VSRHRPGLQRPASGVVTTVAWPAVVPRRSQRVTRGGAKWVVEPASDTRPASRRTGAGAERVVEPASDTRPAPRRTAGGADGVVERAPGTRVALVRRVLAVEGGSGTRVAWCAGEGCRRSGGVPAWHPSCLASNRWGMPRGWWSARMAPRADLVRRVRALPLGRLARRRFTRNAGSPQCSSSGPRWAPRTRSADSAAVGGWHRTSRSTSLRGWRQMARTRGRDCSRQGRPPSHCGRHLSRPSSDNRGVTQPGPRRTPQGCDGPPSIPPDSRERPAESP
jgi:hypothetical protein